MKRIVLLFCCLCCVLLCQAETFVSGGVNRNIIVYAPTDLPQNRPLLISMHGNNQDAGYQRDQARFDLVADTAKFVVVYPDGEGRSWDTGGMKDINFLLDIIDEMERRYSIDKNRVYLSGFSMGGMMTYHAMTKIADRIAAFAPVSGYRMGGPDTSSSRPVPILHVHGTSDDVCVYSGVQGSIDAWVRRNGCSTTPKVEKPQSGPANTSAEMIRYTGGLDGVEVAHLKLPGKGHWHSNDPAVAMTNIEIWNFCQRWSLTAGPEVLSAEPEDGCFDMDATTDRTFVFTLDKPVDCSKVKASMSEGTGSFNLDLAETGFSTTLTFTIPAVQTPKDMEYRLQLRDVYSEDGGKSPTSYYHYTYGIEDVGEQLLIDTLLTQDWAAQQDAIGEGIPYGWHRVNSNSDGGQDERLSGEANTGGCRMKYFTPGGEFDAGFYFASREYNQATFTYGDTPGYELSLTRGHYLLSQRSIYWNDGARNNQSSYGLSVINTRNGNSAFASSSLLSTGCLGENTGQPILGSALHELEFEIVAANNYLLQFSTSSGWDGIILGPPTLTRRPSQADRYKGEFQRTLRRAQQLLSTISADDYPAQATQIEALASVIAQYESLVSIHPADYEAARLALLDAMQPLLPLSMLQTRADATADAPLYNVLGQRMGQAKGTGFYISRGLKTIISR